MRLSRYWNLATGGLVKRMEVAKHLPPLDPPPDPPKPDDVDRWIDEIDKMEPK